MAAPCFCPAATKEGYLPPWEVAKAFAFHTVLQDVAEVQGVQPHELVGKRVDEYISEKEKGEAKRREEQRRGDRIIVEEKVK